MKSLTFLILTILGLALNPLKASIDQIYAKGHGVDFPSEVKKYPQAKNYLAEFDQTHGINIYQEGPLQYFKNDHIGIGLVKDSNQDEGMFQNILRKTDYVRAWGNGGDFIEALEDYTSEFGCIPKVTSTSHGWSSERPGDVHGLSGDKGYNGLYATENSKPDGLMSRWGTRSVEKDLQESINNGKIKFCSRCLIQFYACNVSTLFADTFAKVTGCQTVVSTGKAYPHFNKFTTDEQKFLAIYGAHYWASGAGNWAEKGKSGWYRSTPIRSSQNGLHLIRENIGELYLAR